MESLRLITEIQPLAPTDPKSGSQHQRLPFAQGQLLQGVVSAHNGPQQFTIDIGGLQVAAESNAQLQVGQKLDLQVASLAPRVELQIAAPNSINQRINASVHLLGQQATLLPEILNLATEAQQLPHISATAQETLQLFGDTLAKTPGSGSATTLPLIAQLLDKATMAASAANNASSPAGVNNEIGSLLKQLAASPALSPQLAAQASQLAAVFAPVADQEAIAHTALSGATARLLGQPEEAVPNAALLQTLFQQLTTTIQDNAPLPATHPLRQLLAFLGQVPGASSPESANQPSGPQLETIFNRLGMNLERLLASNNREEAVQTLKFALLELSQQAAATEKSTTQADQLTKTIELYQLLQIRLSGDAVLFQPLPFSFLQQGYLLVDADQTKDQGQDNDGNRSKNAPNVALHLQLEGLGNMEIDIRQDNDRIAVRFLTEDTERAHYMAGFRDELKQWLTAGSLESVQFLTGAKDPTKVLLEKLVHGVTGMIDARA